MEAALALPLFLIAAICMISFQELYSAETVCRVELCEAVMSAGMMADAGGENSEIVLSNLVVFKPAGGLLPTVRKGMTVRAHAWTGKERKPAALAGSHTDEMVYITEKGNKYHRTPGCSAISKGVEAIPGSSLINDRYGGKTYTACSVCSKGQPPASLVYITKTGSRYHNSISCSTIGQAAIMIRKSEAGGRGPCSLCYP